MPILCAEETLIIAACDKKTADKLNIKVEFPIIVINRSAYTVGDKIVEILPNRGRENQFSYKSGLGSQNLFL